MNRISISAAALLLALLCGSGASLDIPKDASRALLAMPDGSKVEADLAITRQLQERVPMFKETVPYNRGVLFVYNEGGSKTFWMKYNYLSLDIVFLDEEMKVSNIYSRVPRCDPARPESEAPRVSAPASFVLALAAGKALRSGLKPGYTIPVQFPRAGTKPRAKRSSTASAPGK